MRLTEKEVNNLKASIKKDFACAKLYLFGSRTDDSKRGGDIDILVVDPNMNKRDLRRIRLNFFSEFGEQKLDIVLDDGQFKDSFTKLILNGAIEL